MLHLGRTAVTMLLASPELLLAAILSVRYVGTYLSKCSSSPWILYTYVLLAMYAVSCTTSAIRLQNHTYLTVT